MPPNSYADRTRIAWAICASVAVIAVSRDAHAADPNAHRKNATEPVTFRHENDVLAGVLFRPEGRGPHPGIVLITGSGDNDRNYHGVGAALGKHFATQGYYCLTWDKPGVGKSTGDFNSQAFHDRANEVLAAVHFLQHLDGVDRRWVGAWGHSQGGMVAPLAASLSNNVGFLIVVAGWQGPAWAQDAVRVEQELRAKGFNEADVADASRFTQRRMALIRGDLPFEVLDKEQEAVMSRRWFEAVHRCDRVLFESARKLVNFDNSATWEQVKCPVLAIYGGKDVSSGPSEPLLAVIRHGLAKAANDDLTIKLFADADHDICRLQSAEEKPEGRRAEKRGRGESPDFVPGYLECMSAWLNEHYEPRAD